MFIHNVKIIESAQFSTQRLFELGLSFRACQKARRWPSLNTMNSFLRRGTDEGALGTDIVWESCTLGVTDYEQAVASVMDGQPFVIDDDEHDWNEWFSDLRR